MGVGGTIALALAISAPPSVVAAPEASAASRIARTPAPRIITPGNVAVASAGRLRVAVRVPKVRGTRFEATISRRDVSSRFGKRRRGVRRATIERLKPGLTTLTVRLAGDTPADAARTGALADQATVYVLGKRKPGLLSLARVRPSHSPVRLRLARPYRQRSGDPRAIRVIRAEVDGQPAAGITGLAEQFGRPTALRISSSFGIRHGRNVVSVTGARADGRFDRRRRVIDLPADRPTDRSPAPGATAPPSPALQPGSTDATRCQLAAPAPASPIAGASSRSPAARTRSCAARARADRGFARRRKAAASRSRRWPSTRAAAT